MGVLERSGSDGLCFACDMKDGEYLSLRGRAVLKYRTGVVR